MNTKPLNVHDYHLGQFETYTGIQVDLNNPTPDMICDKDIIHALSQIPRFGGHCKKRLSVAWHSILVAALAPYMMRFEALLHDAPETYCSDVIKPLKNILGEKYETVEGNFEWVIIDKYGLYSHWLDRIKKYDRQALELEHKAFKQGSFKHRLKIRLIICRAFGWEFFFYTPKYAFKTLLNRFKN
ncbi:HD family hydrolase [Pedobacter sp. BS3]|uniref:HD family hydrolase n=1 Tax=Pedobacter sp. BS3 TaxID=2567937 RepID=UPI0011EDDE4D|nr:HD family hydrolase [Pedobacter sp. BS3]TZF81795.1 HD family hydrolase [Pedobacter sp. BS3]